MVKQMYPRLNINLQYLKENTAAIVERCGALGIDVAGVIKGVAGIPQCAKMFQEGGAKFIASSRLEQLEDALDYGVNLPAILLRVPMLSEAEEVVRLCTISLNSELEVLKALELAAQNQGKKHQIILMADIGDLREGFWNKDDMVDTALYVEKQLPHLTLAGVGTNLGCYGAIETTAEKLEELVTVAEQIEQAIGRKLEYISGGSTAAIMRVLDGNIPPRINLLRIGEGITLARDLDVFYKYDMSFMHQDVFTLQAEIIEIKEKPSYPVGNITIDCFGHTPLYVDRGIRKRALLAMGKVDYRSPEELYPRDQGIDIMGASSDHTILDIQDCSRSLKVGDIVEFDLNYASLVYLASSRNVQKVFI